MRCCGEGETASEGRAWDAVEEARCAHLLSSFATVAGSMVNASFPYCSFRPSSALVKVSHAFWVTNDWLPCSGTPSYTMAKVGGVKKKPVSCAQQ